MMAYCTEADLNKRFGAAEITATASHADAVATAINDAAALIDGFISARYSLPLASTPEIIIRISCVIARRYLYDDKPPETVIDDYSEALKSLADIKAGRLSLPDVVLVTEETGEADYYNGKAYFTDANLTGY